ncbi:MAG TPA: PmoA family protein [Pyrinomonadaceae bacterium]|nr:PmoA family protein [Pyrinomonadaceae bacterium]
MRRFKYLIVLTAVLLALLLNSTGASTASRKIAVTVSAGQWDRHNTIVSFPFKSKKEDTGYLVDDQGASIPLQLDGTTATFVLPDLKAGKSISFQLRYGAKVGSAVELTRVQNRLEIKDRGQQVLSFVAEPGSLPSPDIKPVFLRGGYIHPVFTPKGTVVTDDYPSDHYHHHGIWFAWTKTEFEGKHPDFWNVGDGTGRVDFVKVGKTWSGPVHAGFTSFQNYVALTGAEPKTALNEEWEVKVYSLGGAQAPYFLFDIVATQQCASTSPLILDEYRYGGMGVRGNREWKDKSKVSFLTSEGKTRADGNATRGRWCHIGGPVDGKQVGIAILDHPSNFRAPAPMRLNPDDPFFNYAPSQMGRFEIDPGKQFVLRYRYVISDGPADTKLLEQLWSDYANPPAVRVSGQ